MSESDEPKLPSPMSDDPEGEQAEKAAAQESTDRELTEDQRLQLLAEQQDDIARKTRNPTEQRALRRERYDELRRLIGMIGIVDGLTEDQFEEQIYEYEQLKKEFEA